MVSGIVKATREGQMIPAIYQVSRVGSVIGLVYIISRGVLGTVYDMAIWALTVIHRVRG